MGTCFLTETLWCTIKFYVHREVSQKFAAKCYSSGDEMKGNECKQGRYGSVRFVD